MLPKQTEISYADQLLRVKPQHASNYFAPGPATTLNSPPGASYLDVCIAGISPALHPNSEDPCGIGRSAAPNSYKVETVDPPWSWRPKSNDWNTQWTLNQVVHVRSLNSNILSVYRSWRYKSKNYPAAAKKKIELYFTPSECIPKFLLSLSDCEYDPLSEPSS
uniref:Uncharacterized protein n=1 Tax=Cryptomonas curvata TaxID=233186 RepID=A0A7S0MCW6_9CRYP|mmetsp:Transcript_35322/g.73968  ORF Transcript_35322/g.73968 Transcript_35322/m.73968 type:complete len:163 (+) Transcript_35322:279-767(+)